MKKKMVRNIFINIPGQIIPTGIMFLTTMIFTRVLLPEELSLFYILQASNLLIKTVLYSWITTAIKRYLPLLEEKDKKDSFLRNINKILSWIAIILILLLLVTIFITNQFIDSNKINFVILLFLSVLSIGTFESIQSIFQSELKISTSVFFKVLNSIIMFSLRIIPLFFFDYTNGLFYIITYMLSYFILLPFMILYNHKQLSIGNNKTKNPYPLKELLIYGLPMIGWSMSSTLLSSSDRFLISYYLTESDVGIYSANYNLINSLILVLIIPITQVVHPYLMKQSDKESLKQTAKILNIIIFTILVFSFFMLSGTIIFSETLSYILGNNFREGYRIIPIVFAGLLCWILSWYVHKPLELIKKTKYLFYVSFLVAIVNIFLNIIFIPKFGFFAAAWTTLISYIIYIILVKNISDRIVSIKWHWRLIAVNFAIVVILTIVLVLAKIILFSHLSSLISYFLLFIIYFSCAVPYCMVNYKIIKSFSRQISSDQ